MNLKKIHQILKDTDFIHTSGTPEELRVAEYLKQQAEALGATAAIEAFPVEMADVQAATLLADGKEIPCKGYKLSGSRKGQDRPYRRRPALFPLSGPGGRRGSGLHHL